MTTYFEVSNSTIQSRLSILSHSISMNEDLIVSCESAYTYDLASPQPNQMSEAQVISKSSNYSRQSSSQCGDSGFSSSESCQQVKDDCTASPAVLVNPIQHLPREQVARHNKRSGRPIKFDTDTSTQRSCSIDIEDSLNGVEGIMEKCYNLLMSIRYTSTTCQSTTKCFVHANQSESVLKHPLIYSSLKYPPTTSNPSDQLLQVALGFDLLRQRLMTCAYYKLSGNQFEELRQMSEPVVDPSVEYFGLEWTGVFKRMRQLAISIR
jgi:hypothetical protein